MKSVDIVANGGTLQNHECSLSFVSKVVKFRHKIITLKKNKTEKILVRYRFFEA